MLEMWVKGHPIDVITLCDWMERAGTLATVGGSHYITGLLSVTPTSAHGEYYADTVRYYHQLRDVVSVCSYITRIAFGCRHTNDDLVTLAVKGFEDLREPNE